MKRNPKTLMPPIFSLKMQLSSDSRAGVQLETKAIPILEAVSFCCFYRRPYIHEGGGCKI